MIIDLEQDPPATGELRADVCILGAGPAGISLALELARLRPDWQILLAEAGGPDNATAVEKAIYDVELGAKSYDVLPFSRRRKLGGTSAHWGGWSKPLDATDYEDNPGWDVPAWPFGPGELAPHWAKALAWVEIDQGQFEFSALRERYRDHLLPPDPGGRTAERLFRFSPPTRFGTRYREELAARDNLTCLLHANLVALDRRGDAIAGATLATLGGERVQVKARHFVLAMGGMENTRYLLNHRGERAADGVGIFSSHLGRYFSDHYPARPGRFLAPADLKYHRFDGGEGEGGIMPVLTFAPGVIRRERQHNSCVMLHAVGTEGSLLADYGGSAALGFPPGRYWQYRVQMNVEPRPNPESRLTLTNERCALGLRRLRLDWKPHASDYRSAYALFRTLGDQLSVAGLGRAQLERPDTPEARAAVNGACHHLGTTRMAADERDGVVDRNLKVFDCDNLYVAGSSVFPRYGYSNPTLTIIALSVRLARHLAGGEAQAGSPA